VANTKTKEYATLVNQAESAVASVKDPELRRVAFQKVLEDLLAGGGEMPTTTRRVAKSLGRPPSQSSSRRKVATKGGTQTYVDELVEEGFFKKPKTISNLKAELENRGHHIPMTSLSGPLQRMCQQRVLRRQKMKTSGKRETFGYSNW
jgi:hypothetical protein